MEEDKTSQPEGTQEQGPEESGKKKRERKHWIRPTWLRRTLKVLMWLVVAILLIPVLVYVPPVQTLLKNVACDYVAKTTGMHIEIEKFRLKFPVDVSLQGVRVIEATGDTMVMAREAIADVKLRPLLELDIQIKRLRLLDGYYRMLSPDSSMLLKLKAGYLEVDDKSSMSIPKSQILLNAAKLKDADVSLYMNVWKQKKQPEDTTSTPFFIQVNSLKAENLRFGMSMLPAIDTLNLLARNLELTNGTIDLRESKLHLQRAVIDGGDATYLTPTPEYIAAHPAPVDTTGMESEPFTIVGDTLSLLNFKGLYAMKGARPLPGFDASYIEATDINLDLIGFYNQASTVRLPFTRIQARERCGLSVVEGQGLVEVSELGLRLEEMAVRTPYSNLELTADLPFAAMELKPDAVMEVKARGEVGMADAVSFMPDLKAYTQYFPQGSKLALLADARGSISDISIKRLYLDMPRVFGLDAKGRVRNPMDFSKMLANVDFKGYLSNPSVADKLMGTTGIDIPTFDVQGHVEIARQEYLADIDLRSSAGDLVGRGKVNLNAESYTVDADLRNLEVGRFVPDLGVGSVTAEIHAQGAGFDPTRRGVHTQADVFISHIDYNKVPYKDIELQARLDGGSFDVFLESPNKYLDLTLNASGTIDGGSYAFDVAADVYNLDLYAMGLSPTYLGGHGGIVLKGTAQPDKWLYDVDMTLEDVDCKLDEETEFHFPYGATAHLLATEERVDCSIESDQTSLDFASDEGLKSIVDKLTAFMPMLDRQIAAKNVDMEEVQGALPHFDLRLRAAGDGILHRFLSPQGIELDTVTANLSNTDLIRGRFMVLGLKDGDLKVDTITLALDQRGALMDYKAYIGNAPGTMDEFARVNLNGYLGQNRFSASLHQRNLQGETGYRLGLTGAMQDSVIYLHFTPLKATIAYMPWTFNTDNHIDLGPGKKINASLLAQSKESSIFMETVPDTLGGTRLHAKIDNLHIQDFLQMSATAPPVKGTVNSDLNLVYRGKGMGGKGTLSITGLTYERTKIGNLDFDFAAGTNFQDKTGGRLSMLVDGKPAMSIRGRTLTSTDTDKEPMQLALTLDHFPLKLANAFLEKDVAQLEGALVGHMDMTGSLTKPILNGNIGCDSVAVYVPMIGSKLKFDNDSIAVTDNVLDFQRFNIWGANSNPLTVDGTVNFKKFTNLIFDLALDADNMAVVNNDKRSKGDIYGKLFMNLHATAKGPMSFLDVKANASVLNTTNVTYALPTDPTLMSQTTDAEGVVKFVNFNDTVQVAEVDTVKAPLFSMRVTADLSIANGTRATVILSPNGTDRVELTPSGNLHYSQNVMGDMRLTGQLNLGEGYARYNIPVIGDKKFTFQPNSYVLWRGDVMNPTLNIQGVDKTKAAVSSGSGNTRMVNFDVGLSITNTLSAPKVLFSLATNEDITVQNELASMSPDQLSSTAMNMLITGQYTTTGFGGAGDFNINNQVYGFLTSKLNSWMANNVRGVDLSFGIDQYDQTTDGKSSSSTSYSYQVSKSLFNNKFKIVVGGNYSTDASADENFSQNLVNDIAFEYMVKQTNNLSMYLKLFRHTGYESILEGEITETGLGFVMKRRLSTLRSLFRMPGRRRKSATVDNSTVDAGSQPSPSVPATTDTVPSHEK